jgi:2-amino-4-hydroxy-6-hydroxymethyldihydropteridine diphosphokinase
MASVYIGLGSNLGQSENIIASSLVYLSQNKHIDIRKSSSYYRSKPLDCPSHKMNHQPDYINAVVNLMTDLTALDLLDVLQAVEVYFGRQRNVERWSSRTLDLDILLYDDLVINEVRLTIPHAGMLKRDFVLYPLFEIAPEIELPGFGSISKALDACENRGLEKLNEYPC